MHESGLRDGDESFTIESLTELQHRVTTALKSAMHDGDEEKLRSMQAITKKLIKARLRVSSGAVEPMEPLRTEVEDLLGTGQVQNIADGGTEEAVASSENVGPDVEIARKTSIEARRPVTLPRRAMPTRVDKSENSLIEITEIPRRARGFSIGVLQNFAANLVTLAIAWLWAQSLGLLTANTATTKIAIGIVFVAAGFIVIRLTDLVEERLTFRKKPVRKWVTRITTAFVVVLLAVGVMLGGFSRQRLLQIVEVLPLRLLESLIVAVPGLLAVAIVFLSGTLWIRRGEKIEDAITKLISREDVDSSSDRSDRTPDLYTEIDRLQQRRFDIFERVLWFTIVGAFICWALTFVVLAILSNDPLTSLNFN